MKKKLRRTRIKKKSLRKPSTKRETKIEVEIEKNKNLWNLKKDSTVKSEQKKDFPKKKKKTAKNENSGLRIG